MQKFNLFSPDEIKPSGWTKKQLEIQANGLSGALDKVWRDVRDSAWIGGEAEGWERVPYWLDGFIVLAYLLDDEDKKQRAKRYVDAIIERQNPDGWICPCKEEERATYDLWGAILITKVLMVYYDCAKDARAVEAAYKTLKNLYELLRDGKVALARWGKFRWFECFMAIERLYEERKEEWMLELCKILKEQGADYETFLDDWKVPINHWRLETHIVNIMMALKAEAVSCRLLGKEYDDYAQKLWDVLEKYNATSFGAFTGDECLSGISPIQGTELCSIVELMYSAELLFSQTGDVKWADRLERAAFNGLPATLTEDMWAHQYDQQSNQIECVPFPGKSLFRSNGPGSHIFGLEPHFGCCTANFNQGWPKLCQSIFMREGEDIVSVMPLPAILSTKVGGVDVKIETKTLYPFRNTVEYCVRTSAPVEFKLKIRIPSWAKEVKLDGKVIDKTDYICVARSWNGETSVKLELSREVELKTLGGELYFVNYGPLVFSLPINGRWEMHEYVRNEVERKAPYCDWYVYRDGEFAFGFASDSFKVIECEGGDAPFSRTAPMLKIEADLAPINWEMADGYRNIPAKYPTDRRAVGASAKMTLVPYGCTNLRMTELPFTE